MPTICMFLGIIISMNWNEHNPPYFHVQYAEYKACVDIQANVVISGYIPNRQLKYVLAWAEFHKDELMQNWELSKRKETLNQIAPIF